MTTNRDKLHQAVVALEAKLLTEGQAGWSATDNVQLGTTLVSIKVTRFERKVKSYFGDDAEQIYFHRVFEVDGKKISRRDLLNRYC